jgi:hypothetical protein
MTKMKLTNRSTNYDIFGDDVSETILVVVEDLENKPTTPCLVFHVFPADYGGVTGIECLGKFDYMEVLDVLQKAYNTLEATKGLKLLKRLD